MVISGIRSEQMLNEPPAGAPGVRAAPAAAAGESPFARALQGIAHEVDVGEVQTANASQLRSYDTGTLIALQVGIYRYTEAVDLASKIVDRATNAVRTVLQGGGH
jgi:2-keto-3-deoxy-6-phosphogluconate aldolase